MPRSRVLVLTSTPSDGRAPSKSRTRLNSSERCHILGAAWRIRECRPKPGLPFRSFYVKHCVDDAGLRIWQGNNCGHISYTAGQDLGINIATPVGTLVGQLLFRWLAHKVGRKRMCKLTAWLIIIIMATFGQTLASPTRYRSSAYGISAASGRLGSIIPQLAFQYLII
ncbi:hypothetical protein BD309DRAFT_953244 [Dichomitus squalens]|nr:hypothetical protein BD309DRAFT_953244 [Dichomitus squalens]